MTSEREGHLRGWLYGRERQNGHEPQRCMRIGLFRPAFCRDIRLLGKDGTLQSPLDNLPLCWFMCADGRGVLSAGVEIVPVS